MIFYPQKRYNDFQTCGTMLLPADQAQEKTQEKYGIKYNSNINSEINRIPNTCNKLIMILWQGRA